MDGQPDQGPDAQPMQRDQPLAFSINTGSIQPAQAQPQTPQPQAPQPAVIAPPPLTPPPPTPSTPLPASAAPSQPLTPPPAQTPGVPAQTPAQPMVITSLRKPGPLGRPFPLPLSLLIVFGSVALLALVFALRVVVLGGDWSEGAAAAGIIALALAVVTLLVALLRVAAGRRTLGFMLASLLLLVALAGAGAGGLVGSGSLHLAQAKAMEASGQWGIAVHEYALSGQKGPNAPDIARVQNEWGEQLLGKQNYQDALTHFQTVLDDYQQSGDQVARAQKGEFRAYVAWLKDDPSHVPYREAITIFVNFGSSAACDSSCQTTLSEVAPQAYYLYGSQLLTQKRYELAIAEFAKLATQYSSSDYAQQAYSKAATAYLAYGKQQISNENCGGAVTTFKTLVANYKDTPEAAQAQIALAAPQDVTGVIANAPTNPLPTMHLSKHINPSAFYFSNEYTAKIDPGANSFTFKLVAQGVYYLSATRPISGGIDYYTWPGDNGNANYSFTVTPLCTNHLDGIFSFT